MTDQSPSERILGVTRKSPCLSYGEDHEMGVANCIEYQPNFKNALDQTKGTWVIVNMNGESVMQADYCPACGTELPLRPLGQRLDQQQE